MNRLSVDFVVDSKCTVRRLLHSSGRCSNQTVQIGGQIELLALAELAALARPAGLAAFTRLLCHRNPALPHWYVPCG